MPRTRDKKKRASTDVEVRRVYDGSVYARVNSIGVGSIRPFLLIPGIGVSSTYFERLAPILNEFGPVYAVDLPGFGGVPHPGTALTIGEYADLVGAVVDDLGLVDPVLVGHSMGSQIAVDLAARRPELTTVALIGPVVNPAERRVVTQARRFVQAAWHEPAKVKVLAVSAYLFCGFRWFSRILPEMMSYRIEDRLPRVSAHTLVIRGEHDHVAPREWVERVGGLLPSSRLWEIPGAAHSVMYAHAEEVARLCVEHARRTLPGDDDTLRVAELNRDDDLPPLTPAQAAGAVAGRVVETVGVMRDDDAMIERGKTRHAEAVQRDEHGDDEPDDDGDHAR